MMNARLLKACEIGPLRPVLLVLVMSWGGPRTAAAEEIHDAAARGDLETVKALLDANPDLLNARDDGNQTPLDFARTPLAPDHLAEEQMLQRKAVAEVLRRHFQSRLRESLKDP